MKTLLLLVLSFPCTFYQVSTLYQRHKAGTEVGQFAWGRFRTFLIVQENFPRKNVVLTINSITILSLFSCMQHERGHDKVFLKGNYVFFNSVHFTKRPPAREILFLLKTKFLRQTSQGLEMSTVLVQ